MPQNTRLCYLQNEKLADNALFEHLDLPTHDEANMGALIATFIKRFSTQVMAALKSIGKNAPLVHFLMGQNPILLFQSHGGQVVQFVSYDVYYLNINLYKIAHNFLNEIGMAG